MNIRTIQSMQMNAPEEFPTRRRQMTDNIKPLRAALLGSGLPVFTASDAAGIPIPTQLVRGEHTPGFQRRIRTFCEGR